MNEMKCLGIEFSKLIGNRTFWPCRPSSAVKTVLTADEGLRGRNVLLSVHLLHSMLRHFIEPT